jgi:hypothetical protein
VTVLDRQGNPLVINSDRRNEVQRCIEVIGWSWMKLADRLGVKAPTALAIKNCKRPIADSDLRWLQALADAVTALPRPAEVNDPEPVQGAPIVQGGMSVATSDLNPAMDQAPSVSHDMPAGDMVARIREELAEQQAVAIVSTITNLYMHAVPGVGPDALNQDNVAGARWALSEMANALGVLDLVQDQLRSFQASAAQASPMPVGAIGGVSEATRQPMA